MRINTCIIHAKLDNVYVVCASHKGITSQISLPQAILSFFGPLVQNTQIEFCGFGI